MLTKFWHWYEKNLILNTRIASGLFIIQLIHLYWLTTDVVLLRLTGNTYFPISSFWQNLLVIADYTEIPALIATSILYINSLRKKRSLKPILFLILLNSQWLHIFWITDEFVVNGFNGTVDLHLPVWLAWVAIGIDYLELPVIFDTIKLSLKNIFKSNRVL